MESKLRYLSKTLITAAMLLSLSCASTDTNETPGNPPMEQGSPGTDAPPPDGEAREGSCTTNQTSQCCGDDVCDGPETSETCPEDCGDAEEAAPTEEEEAPEAEADASGD